MRALVHRFDTAIPEADLVPDEPGAGPVLGDMGDYPAPPPAEDGPIGEDQLANVDGQTVAFVDQGSTSGYLVPALQLLNAGVDPQTGITPLFAGGHDAAQPSRSNVATTIKSVNGSRASTWYTSDCSNSAAQ